MTSHRTAYDERPLAVCGEAHLSYYRQRVHASATTAIYLLHDERSSFALRDAANSVRGIDRMSRSLAAPPYYFPGGLTAVVNDSKTAHLASAFFCPNVHTLSFCSAPPRGRGALAHAPPYITKAYKYIYLSNTRGRVQSIQNFAATCRRHSSGEKYFLLMEISVGLHVYFPNVARLRRRRAACAAFEPQLPAEALVVPRGTSSLRGECAAGQRICDMRVYTSH